MPQDDRKTPGPQAMRRAALLYLGSVAALGAVLLLEFAVSYSLLRDHPTHAPGLITEVYGALAVGLLLLVVQLGIVFGLLVRPLREALLRAQQLTQALDKHSHSDLLTGTLNRTAFDQIVVRELEAFKRYGMGLCAILLDVDRYREINERLGYEAGDQILCDLAAQLKTHMRKADFLFRWRSGKFMILASGIDVQQATRFATKLCELVAGHDFRRAVRVTACAGVAATHAEDTPELLVARVKTALANAKGQGPGSVAEINGGGL